MKIVILGAGGFIGSHLVEHLVKRGDHSVVGVDVTDEKLVGLGGPNFTFREGDIHRDGELLQDVIADAHVVADLVAYANPSLYNTAPLDVFDLNFMQNLRVMDLCIKHHKWLIQYSSAEVYGKSTAGSAYFEDETDLVMGPVHKQRWMYATGKMLLERVLYANGVEGLLDYTIVRPFNFIGSRIDYLVPPGSMGGPRVFAHYMSALLTGGPIYLVDGGWVHRAFMHIDDANTAFQTLLDHPRETRNETFNVGNPANNLTVRQLAELMLELYQELTGERAKSRLVVVSPEEFYGKGYEDSDRLPPSITKMRKLGWQPRYDMARTLRDAMVYYLERKEKSLASMQHNQGKLKLA